MAVEYVVVTRIAIQRTRIPLCGTGRATGSDIPTKNTGMSAPPAGSFLRIRASISNVGHLFDIRNKTISCDTFGGGPSDCPIGGK